MSKPQRNRTSKRNDQSQRDQVLLKELVRSDFNANAVLKIVVDSSISKNSGSANNIQSQVALIDSLLERLTDLDTQLNRLEHAQANDPLNHVVLQPESLRLRMSTASSELASLQSTLSTLDKRAAGVSQIATRVGVRMRHAEEQSKRALQAITTLQHVDAFATARDPSELPAFFHDDAKLAEAAEVAGKLHVLLQRAVEGRSAAQVSDKLQAAADQLDMYLSILDNRIVFRFDSACDIQDFKAMAACCTAMTAARGSDALLVSRYISTRAVFANPQMLERLAGVGTGDISSPIPMNDSWSQDDAYNDGFNSPTISSDRPSPAKSIPGATPQNRVNPELFRFLSNFLREEAVVMEQAFIDPETAIATLVQRVFEQTLQGLLVDVLALPPSDASPDVLRQHLQLMTDTHRKALAVAEEGRTLGGAAVGDPADLAATACGDALDNYLAIELAYLAQLGSSKVAGKTVINQETVLDLLSMNEEAVKRCISISQGIEGEAAGSSSNSVRLVFHSTSPSTGASVPGGLLGLVGNYLLLGLESAGDLCCRRLVGQFKPPSIDQTTKRNAAWRERASVDVGQPISIFLITVSEVAACMALLQDYYKRVIYPHTSKSEGERQACATGLAELVTAIDRQTGSLLQKIIDHIGRKVELTLTYEQKKTDFRPGDADTDQDTATDACAATTAMLYAVGAVISQQLHGSNSTAFITELAQQVISTIHAHMLKYTYSPAGALRWQRDLAEYTSCLVDDLGAISLKPLLDELHAVSNLLVVSPESLSHVVSALAGTTMINKVVARREDFKSLPIVVDS